MATIIKCKMCGGDLNIVEGASIAECEFCGSKQTVPVVDDEKKLIQFERAERLRKQCEFDKAAGIYESIVEDFRQEAEAYWGLVLCKYGIEYVDDPATSKKIPTCHRSSFDSIMEDSDFEQVLENADSEARKVYREEAKAIEEIRKGIIAVSANEEPYDIFICYKETDEKGERTLDSVLAQDVYDALTDKGYRVFFSRITLEDRLGVEYEPFIFAALHSAKVMLAFGTDYEYFNAVWVKNEWSRFLKLMTKDKTKHLIPCFKGIDAYDMPKEFAKLQAQDLGKVGAMQDLLRGIEKLLEQDKKQPQRAVQPAGLDEMVSNLLSEAYAAMERKEWETADALLEKAENSEMSTSQRILMEPTIRQKREETLFHLRCKMAVECNRPKEKRLIITAVLAFVIGTVLSLDLSPYCFAANIAFTVFPCILALEALRVVPKTKGSRSALVTASNIVNGVGLLIAGLVMLLICIAVPGIAFVVDAPIRMLLWALILAIQFAVNFFTVLRRVKV